MPFNCLSDTHNDYLRKRSPTQLSAVFDIYKVAVPQILTPNSNAFQPALRADVIREEVACDHLPLTCTVFDPMVHSNKWSGLPFPCYFHFTEKARTKHRSRSKAYRYHPVPENGTPGHTAPNPPRTSVSVTATHYAELQYLQIQYCQCSFHQ